MAYCDTNFADTYFQKRAFETAWNGVENESVKQKYLETASQMIQDYCYFWDDDTDTSFTYDTDDETQDIPVWLKRATCEQALHLLNLGKDPTQNDKKTTTGLSSSEGNVFNKDFRADILGVYCRAILKANGGILAEGASAEDSSISGGYFEK